MIFKFMSCGYSKTDRLLRLPQVLNKIPVSKSTWWAGVKSGLYPQGIRLSQRTTAWRESDIDALIARLADGDVQNCGGTHE